MNKKNTLLSLIKDNARISINDLSDVLSLSEKETFDLLETCFTEGLIVKYTAVFNDDRAFPTKIKALIELCVQPERKSGYHALADRISHYEHVVDLYLISGDYDFLVVVEGNSLKEISNCVSDLASIDSVHKTATHVVLNTYKKMGAILSTSITEDRLSVSP
jgi:DNA-binding Lrp family transcriptional regulator